MRSLPLLAAVVVSLAAALFASLPAPLDRTVVVGHWNHPDALSNHWLLVWVAEQVWTGGSLVHNDRYWWPVGDHPFLAGNGSEGFLYLPFHLGWGWPYGVTLYCVAVLVGNGLVGWWGARRLGAPPWGAVVAAAALGANPYVLQEMGSGRFTQANLVFLGLTLGWIGGFLRDVRAGRSPGIASGAAGGAAWGVATVLYWYHGYFAVIAGLALLLPHLAHTRQLPWRPALAFAATGLAIIAGPLAFYLSHWDRIPGTDELVAFPHREAWGDAIAWVLPFDVLGSHGGYAVSAVTVALALLGLGLLLRRGSEERTVAAQLGLLVVLGLLLARGPRLLGDWPDLYTLFYGWAPPLRRFWWPSRHLVLVHWSVAILAAVGAGLLLERLRRPFAAVGTLALCATVPLALHLQDDLSRLPLSRFEVPDFYRQLAALPDGVVAEVPISPRLSGNQQLLVYQMVHRKPLLLGHAAWVDRVRPPGWDELVGGNSFLSALIAWEEGRSEVIAFEAEDLLALREAGLRWFVFNREYVPMYGHDRYHRVLGTLFGPPTLGDNRAKAYDLHAWTGETSVEAGRFRLAAGTRPSNGVQPLVGLRPESLGFGVLRDTPKPFAGLHPSGGGNPRGGAPRPPPSP